MIVFFVKPGKFSLKIPADTGKDFLQVVRDSFCKDPMPVSCDKDQNQPSGLWRDCGPAGFGSAPRPDRKTSCGTLPGVAVSSGTERLPWRGKARGRGDGKRMEFFLSGFRKPAGHATGKVAI